MLVVDAFQLDLEYQCGSGWDEAWETTVTIRQMTWDCQNGLLTQGHLHDTLIPAFDNSPNPDLCFEVPSTHRGVELLASVETVLRLRIIEVSSVLNYNGISLLWLINPISLPDGFMVEARHFR